MDARIPDLASLTPAARRILDAASELFYEHGVHAVGVDTIAAVAGVTKKTLYDRFGSKEALVVSYLQHRDGRWRTHLDAELQRHPDPGMDRVLAVFDAAMSWAGRNSPKGCSAINARAELDATDGGLVLPEVVRQKAWLRDLFEQLCGEAGIVDPAGAARALTLLYEGAIVTVGMSTFADPFEVARDIAESLLSQRSERP